MRPSNHTCGELIRNARTQKRLNQTALGARLRPKMTQGTISNWENHGPPNDRDILKQLESILSIRLENALGNDEDQDQSQQVVKIRHLSETTEDNAEEANSVNSHTAFKVLGPILIPCQHKGGGWALFDSKKAQNQFWEKDQHLRSLKNGRGVYIYAFKTSEGTTPIYLGKATKGFAQECFNHANQTKYLNGLATYRKGTAVMFFIVHQSKAGQTNRKAIGEIEQRLIQLAEIKNPGLKNTHYRISGKWSIEGIIGNNRGPQTNPAKALRNALGLAEEEVESTLQKAV